MRMAPPELWSETTSPTAAGKALGLLLRAAEPLFRSGLSCRDVLYRRGWLVPTRARIPVISVGGIEVGGVGKTPLVLELARLALRAGMRPAVLSRGYKGRMVPAKGALRVPLPLPEDAAQSFGDEPASLAEAIGRMGGLGVWVARDRRVAAEEAEAAGADLAILDDGFQHRRLHREADVVSLSGDRPLGNGHLLPAGPLREPPRALARAGRIVLSSAEPETARRTRALLRPFLREGAEIFSWHGEPSLEAILGAPPSPGEGISLLAGIAHPERLLGSLSRLGFAPARLRLLPDHHLFRREDLADWIAQDTASGGSDGPGPRAGPFPLWVTTEKDWVRLRPLLLSLGWCGEAGSTRRVALLRQRLIWNEPGAEDDWERWLRRIVTRAG